MSLITIQCRLVADEPTRHHLWELMAGVYTPFVNTLLMRLAVHPDSITWQQKGKLPSSVVNTLVSELRHEDPFSGLSARWIASAQNEVTQIYKAWLKGRQQLHNRQVGKQKWLAMLQSDQALAQLCGSNLAALQGHAQQLLNNPPANWFQAYYEAETSQDALACSAIAYLLKHGRRIPSKPEDEKKLARKRRKIEIQIERLQQQIEGRIPQGRDLSGAVAQQALDTGKTTHFEETSAFQQWQAQIMTQPARLPFPVQYTTNASIVWSKDPKGRLCVKFSGLSQSVFKVHCDQRQLRWLHRFWEDQQTFKASKGQHSEALFTLRSAQLLWKEGDPKGGDPWQANYVYLNCTLDTRLWFQEGTEIVRQEKAAKAQHMVAQLEQRGELSATQMGFRNRQQATVTRLHGEFLRPHHRVYKGQPNLIAALTIDIHHLASVALVDVEQKRVIAWRSLKQLLGKDYNLVHRLRYQQRDNLQKRKACQRKGQHTLPQESPLAVHVERLIAKAVVIFTQEHLAGSIAIPQVRDIREEVQAQIQSRAEQRIPDSKEIQRQYAKQYRMNAHRWSYGRLLDAIRSSASKASVVVEEGILGSGTRARDQALELAMSVYHLRIAS
ncbi:MAG: type V CRISPR-associated protein Cas12k [Cyanophyceae cyanobacterium]